MKGLLLAAILVVAACSAPGEYAGDAGDGYNWRTIEGPDGQECLVLEKNIGTQYAMMGLDCNWKVSDDN